MKSCNVFSLFVFVALVVVVAGRRNSRRKSLGVDSAGNSFIFLFSFNSVTHELDYVCLFLNTFNHFFQSLLEARDDKEVSKLRLCFTIKKHPSYSHYVQTFPGLFSLFSVVQFPVSI